MEDRVDHLMKDHSKYTLAVHIQELEYENARLREALENLTHRCREYCFDECRRDCEPMTECRFYRARAALASKDPA